MEKKIKTTISITILLCFVIMFLFDVFPGSDSIGRDIRVALYLIIDFSVSCFSWKVSSGCSLIGNFTKKTIITKVVFIKY